MQHPTTPIIADLHAHTHHSHGQAGTMAMFESALAHGLKIFGFSEHSPRPAGYVYPKDYQEKLTRQFPDYVREVREAAELGKKQGVAVLLGLEMDHITGQEAYARSLCQQYPYDYVIGGLHFQGAWGFDSSADDWAALSEEQRYAAYARYYKDLAGMCATGLYNIAAHPDLIKIFSVESFHAWLTRDGSLDLVRDALAAIRENGMAMEISSAGLRKPCNEIYPCPQIVRMAADMKLPISFGSDAHCTNTPAHSFDQLARYAASFGYAESLIFEQRRPRAVPFTAPSAL